MSSNEAQPTLSAPPALHLGNLHDVLAGAPACLAFAKAWDRLRGDKLVPTRDDLLPELLGAAMQAISVLHVEAPDRITIRLASANYERLVGRPAKGSNYVDMAAPADRPLRIERHQKMLRTPCGGIAYSRIVPPGGLAVIARNLILPVAQGPDGPINYIYNAAHIERGRRLVPLAEQDFAPLAAEFDYVDIGAGLPR